MNVIDSLKQYSVPEIADYCQSKSIPASVAMININGDFNLSTMVRNANFFGFRSVHYVGKKKWDKRGSVGTHHYTPMFHYKTEEEFIKVVASTGRSIISIENNVPEFADMTYNLFDFDFANVNEPIFVFGEESCGLSKNIFKSSACILTIPNYGSVRSLNVGTTSGIVMGLYRNFAAKHLGY
jgi:tRNA G18 (ribose-2'-O)-methylase SpoU